MRTRGEEGINREIPFLKVRDCSVLDGPGLQPPVWRCGICTATIHGNGKPSSGYGNNGSALTRGEAPQARLLEPTDWSLGGCGRGGVALATVLIEI